MLEDLDLERVFGRLGVVGPQVGLLEVDAVERLEGFAVLAVGDKLALAEGASE